MRDVFIRTLLGEARRDPRIVLITGDLGFKVFDEFRDELPKNFINAGVAEQNMTGLAVGMALEGKIVFTYSIANFAGLRCLEQIRNDACYHEVNVNIVSIGAGFSYGALGISHHATEDISILRALPGITVCSPGCDYEVEECTKALISGKGASYLRLDRSSAGNTKREAEAFRYGNARVVKEGGDLTLIATGGILKEALLASKSLEEKGIRARVISVHSIKPLDVETISTAAKETAGIIVVEEHSIEGGLGGAIAENILEMGAIPGFFVRLGLRSEFSSIVGDQDYLREHYGLSAKAIERVAIEKLTIKQTSKSRRSVNA